MVDVDGLCSGPIADRNSRLGSRCDNGWIGKRFGGRHERGDGVVTLPEGPVQAFDVELGGLQGLPPVDGGRARLLVRRNGTPLTLCVVDVPPEGLEPAALAQRLTDLIGPLSDAESTIAGDGDGARRRESAVPGPHMTVQIATHNRPGPLRRCLDSVAVVDYTAFDVIVIDNAPTTMKPAPSSATGSGPIPMYLCATSANPSQARPARTTAA